MGGQITALKVQKRNPQRVSVYVDGRFALGLAAIAAAHLRVGEFLSDEDIVRLRQQDGVERAAERGMDLLSYRPRSRAEIAERLSRKGHDPAAVEVALGRLGGVGLVDDREFARYWVENRAQFNPRGKAILRRELRQKGVDEAIIEDVLSDYDEEKAASRVAAAAIRRLRGLDAAVFRRKLGDLLRRRGFPYDIIEPLVSQAGSEHTFTMTSEEGE